MSTWSATGKDVSDVCGNIFEPLTQKRYIEGNDAFPDGRKSLFYTSRFPVSVEQEVRKHLLYGLLITRPKQQANMETHQWGFRLQPDSKLRGGGGVTTFHLLRLSFISVQSGLCVFIRLSVCVFVIRVHSDNSNQCIMCFIWLMYLSITGCTHFESLLLCCLSVWMCVDLDECVEMQHRCQQRCINTFGSFMCGCDDGYQLAHDQTSCAGACLAVCVSVKVICVKEFFYIIVHISRCGWVLAACSCNRLCVRLC